MCIISNSIEYLVLEEHFRRKSENPKIEVVTKPPASVQVSRLHSQLLQGATRSRRLVYQEDLGQIHGEAVPSLQT
eukprot:c21928_g2_i4 orf=1070-1294(+)